MIKKYCLALGAMMVLSLVGAGASVGATLSDSTSLTVVNVTKFTQSYDITHWTGYWPSTVNETLTSSGVPGVTGREVYMHDVTYTTHSMHWVTVPYARPYPVFPNTINSMIAAIFSRDGGKTFDLVSWDYLTRTTSGKGTEKGMPDCWMGAMVHSLCDRKPGECNGRYRSNLYFSEWPTGNTKCWASSNPQ